MKDSSNNAVILIILAVALFAVFAIMHFVDQPSNSAKMYSGVKSGSSKSINLNASSGDGIYSDNLSGYKARATSGNTGAPTLDLPGSVSLPTATIAQTDVQNAPQKQSASANAASIYNKTQSKTFKTSNADMLAIQQNTPKSDINATLKTRTAEVAPVATKKATTATIKKGPQKADPKPINPGMGGSLPIGDGTWLMLLMMGMYATRKIAKHPILKESVIC